MRYLHSMIRVADLEASLHFWCELLGLQEVTRFDVEQGRFTLIFLAAPRDMDQAKQHKAPLLELTYNWPDEPGQQQAYSDGRNFGHVAFAVEDIYASCQRLRDGGVTINRPPRDGHMAFVRSPDGISVELLQAGEALPAAEPWVSMPNVGEW